MTLTPETAAAPAASVTPARTWSFVDRRTGESVAYRCMDGCTLDHSRDEGRVKYREDIWCWFWDRPLSLPVNETGTPEELNVLSTVIKVEPWSPTIAHRLPFAVVELIDDQFIDGLDPDGYETLINTLQNRVDQMREGHRRLVEVRASYRTRAS
jgi:hypothetical protein